MMMTTMVTTIPATTPPLPEEESPPLADVLLGGIIGVTVGEVVAILVEDVSSTGDLLDGICVPLPLVSINVNKEILVISSINGRWYQKAL